MNVKKFQAPTMREALEQVKQELGEDALVLDTKRIRSRSFFGKGGQDMIEVRVAADSAKAAAASAPPKKATRSSHGITTLNLTDDAVAAPVARAENKPAYAALTARASSLATESAAPQQQQHAVPAKTANAAATTAKRGVELATTPPRIVHHTPISRGANNPVSVAPNAASVESAPSGNVAAELERLRAELREVKFSLNSLAARPSQNEELVSGGEAEGLENDPELYHSPFYEAYRELTLAGLPSEYAHAACRAAILSGLSNDHDPLEVARFGLCQALPSFARFSGDPLSPLPNTQKKYTAAVFIGPTGVGKTTTIAKLAARLALRERRRIELITLDTYRIAAVEQLKTYAEIIGTRCHVARSVMEVDTLTRRFAGEATVLIDTVGRNPHDLADQMELADYLRECDDLAKCLVLQATTHPVDAAAVISKFALYGANHLVLTKLDETARPLATVGMAAESGLPLAYLCHGQRVPEDIELATADAYSRRAVRSGLNVA